MDAETPISWLAALYQKRAKLERRLKKLRSLSKKQGFRKESGKSRSEGEFRYLELPIKLDRLMSGVEGPISTTEITDRLVKDRDIDRNTWISINRNVSRLLNLRMRKGRVRKLGRAKGSNRAVRWEWLD